MLPQRPETVTTLAARPEHADEHEERPQQISHAAHTAILGVTAGPSRLSRLLTRDRTPSSSVVSWWSPNKPSSRRSAPSVARPRPPCSPTSEPATLAASPGTRTRTLAGFDRCALGLSFASGLRSMAPDASDVHTVNTSPDVPDDLPNVTSLPLSSR